MDMFTPEEIRALRKELGLSPTAFAMKLGVTENTVRRWETGDRHPKYDMVVRLNELRDGRRAAAGKKVKAHA